MSCSHVTSCISKKFLIFCTPFSSHIYISWYTDFFCNIFSLLKKDCQPNWNESAATTPGEEEEKVEKVEKPKKGKKVEKVEKGEEGEKGEEAYLLFGRKWLAKFFEWGIVIGFICTILLTITKAFVS